MGMKAQGEYSKFLKTPERKECLQKKSLHGPFLFLHLPEEGVSDIEGRSIFFIFITLNPLPLEVIGHLLQIHSILK